MSCDRRLIAWMYEGMSQFEIDNSIFCMRNINEGPFCKYIDNKL